MLPKRHRLKRSADIRRVYRQGQRHRHPLLTLYAARAGSNGVDRPSRFAVSAGRRVGNAVVRNRGKRLVREALRAHLPALAPGWDCLLAARPALAGATYAEVEEAVCTLLRRVNLLAADPGPAEAPIR